MYKDLIISTLYFSYIDDEFEETVILDPEKNIQQIIPLNFLTVKTIGYSQNFMVQPFKWLDIHLGGDISYTDSKSKIPNTLKHLNGWNGFFSANSDISFNKDKTLVLNIFYGYVTKGVDNLDSHNSFNLLAATLKAQLLKKQLVVSLFVNDILSTNRPTFTTYYNGIKNSFTNYFDEQFFRLSIIYKIGKPFEKQERENKNIDELDRAK